MSTASLVSIVLPSVVGFIMFGLGLALDVKDFGVVIKAPKPILLGLFIQMLIGPALALVLAHAFNLPMNLAIGFLLLAASPGGTTSNIFSHLAKGDVALNVTLTAINSILSFIYVPLLIYLTFMHFKGAGTIIDVPVAKIAETIFLILIPLFLGMIVRAKSLSFALRADPWVRNFAGIFLAIIAIVGIKNEWAHLRDSGLPVFIASLLFSIGNLSIAYLIPKFLAMERRKAIAISFEVGVHSTVLPMTIAMSPALLNNSEMAIPSIFYSLISIFTCGFLVRIFLRYQNTNDVKKQPVRAYP